MKIQPTLNSQLIPGQGGQAAAALRPGQEEAAQEEGMKICIQTLSLQISQKDLDPILLLTADQAGAKRGGRQHEPGALRQLARRPLLPRRRGQGPPPQPQVSRDKTEL